MKKVFQEISHPRDGDCLSACIASLLELPLADVPKFARDAAGCGSTMMDECRKWLAEKHGYAFVFVHLKDLDDPMLEDCIFPVFGGLAGAPCIASGRSGNVPGAQHAIVGQLGSMGMSFEMTHDPNPIGKGIIGRPQGFYFLVPLEPHKR